MQACENQPSAGRSFRASSSLSPSIRERRLGAQQQHRRDLLEGLVRCRLDGSSQGTWSHPRPMLPRTAMVDGAAR